MFSLQTKRKCVFEYCLNLRQIFETDYETKAVPLWVIKPSPAGDK